MHGGDPSKVPVLVDVGDIDGKLGQDESALAKYDQALATAKTAQDRIRVYESIRNFYSSRGQMGKAIDQVNLLWAEQEKSMAPITAKLMKLEDLKLLVEAGQGQFAFEVLTAIEEGLHPPLKELAHIGYLAIYIEVEDPSKFRL